MSVTTNCTWHLNQKKTPILSTPGDWELSSMGPNMTTFYVKQHNTRIRSVNYKIGWLIQDRKDIKRNLFS